MAIDRSNILLGFKFESWNLAEFSLVLDYALQNPKKFGLTRQNFDFLDNLSNYLTTHIIQKANQVLEIKVNPSNYNLSKLITLYLANTAKAAHFIESEIPDLLKIIDGELKSVLKSTDEKNKNNYVMLLENLLICSSAILKSTALIKSKISDTNSTTKSKFQPLKLANELGVIYLPMIQGLHPLGGTSYTQNDPMADFKGGCGGYVLNWSDQIRKLGHAVPAEIVDANAQEKQKYFSYLTQHTPWVIASALDPNKLTNEILKTLKQEHIYVLNLRIEGESGHAVGLRRIPNTSLIEFYEPNLGIFLFQNDKHFSAWFTQLIISYQLEGINFNEGELMTVGDQRKTATPSIPFFDRKVTHEITSDSINETVKNIASALDEEDNILNVSQLQFMIYAYLRSEIDYIMNPEEIENIKKNLESINFLFQKNEQEPSRSLKTFFSRSINNVPDPWQHSKIGKEIYQLMESRKATLSKAPGP